MESPAEEAPRQTLEAPGLAGTTFPIRVPQEPQAALAEAPSQKRRSHQDEHLATLVADKSYFLTKAEQLQGQLDGKNGELLHGKEETVIKITSLANVNSANARRLSEEFAKHLAVCSERSREAEVALERERGVSRRLRMAINAREKLRWWSAGFMVVGGGLISTNAQALVSLSSVMFKVIGMSPPTLPDSGQLVLLVSGWVCIVFGFLLQWMSRKNGLIESDE